MSRVERVQGLRQSNASGVHIKRARDRYNALREALIQEDQDDDGIEPDDYWCD